MPTHLIDSQLARFKTNALEPFDKVNIGIKSILASHVIQSKNLANALDHHNICREKMSLPLSCLDLERMRE